MDKIIKTILCCLLIFAFCLTFPPKILAVINFSISNPVVDSDDIVEVDATISGLTSSSNCSVDGCYLQAELLSAGGTFGYTYNNSGDYIDFFQPESIPEIKSELFNFIPVAGVWSGKLQAKNNPQNKFYYGQGAYVLLFRRFTGNSTTPTSGDSNSLTVNLTAEIPTPTPTDNPTVLPTPTDTPTPLILKTAPPTPAPTKTPTPAPTKTPTPKQAPTPTNDILGLATISGTIDNMPGLFDSPDPTVPSAASDESVPENNFPLLSLIFVGGGLVLVGISIFLAFRKQKQNPLL